MIDTLETSIKLETSGFTNDQAKALTEVIANNESIEIKRINKKIDVLDNNIGDLQKNVDYKFEKVDEKLERLDSKIDNVSIQLNSKIDKFREESTSQFKWVIGLIFLMSGLLGTLITLLKLF